MAIQETVGAGLASRTSQKSARGVLGIDTPDDLSSGVTAVSEPSAELLDRARVGWERFIGGAEESSDD